MKCSIVLHFIWVSTVCKSTHLGVSPIQRANFVGFLIHLLKWYILQAKERSEATPVNHGDVLQLGDTKLLCHIHSGSDTCIQCEPGIVIANHIANQPQKGRFYAQLLCYETQSYYAI